MKIFRGLVDLISKPTKTKIFLIAIGIVSGIWIYSKVYQYKNENHSLMGIIISSIPLIIILSLMGDVSEVKKPEVVEARKENSLPILVNHKPHIHNMYKEKRQLPTMIEVMESRETKDEIISRRKRIYYGGNYND